MTELNTAPARFPNRSVIRLSGPDAHDLLQRVITTDIAAIAPGECRPGALLTPQGRLLIDFMIFVDTDIVWLDIPAISQDSLLKRLTLYRLKAKADIEADAGLNPVWSETPFNGSTPDPRCPGKLHRALSHDATGPRLAPDQVEIAAGVPAFGRDYAEGEVFPTDVNMDVFGGIGWKKGCFIGQEVVSRMKRRGTIRKRSLAVTFDSDASPAGTPVTAAGTTLGEITSSDGNNAIARIRTDRLEKDGCPAEAGGQPARIAPWTEPV